MLRLCSVVIDDIALESHLAVDSAAAVAAAGGDDSGRRPYCQ